MNTQLVMITSMTNKLKNVKRNVKDNTDECTTINDNKLIT